VPYYRITGLLSPEGAEEVLAQILEEEPNFSPLTGDRNFLRLPSPLPSLPIVSNRLSAVLPTVQDRLAIDLANPTVELYVHAYNDGTYFGRHSDAHGGGNWRRRISCVYYLHRRPPGFQGGSLVVYDRDDAAHAVAPEHNSAVFFPSGLFHEVLPVTCPTRAFKDSRFGINIWIM
jgi:Rps23 Pro-64 3,4-dihydroxylase Tpa1-like proline 4-hydroxylase